MQLVMDLPGGPRESVGEPSRSGFLEVWQVADFFGFHPSTIRANLVPINEWKHGDSTIPATRIGRKLLIPRWWFDAVKKLAYEPPKSSDSADGEDDRGEERSPPARR
jgi:hypothetical protein